MLNFKGVKEMNKFKRPYYHNYPAVVNLETENKKLISFLFSNKRIIILNISKIYNANIFNITYKKLDK